MKRPAFRLQSVRAAAVAAVAWQAAAAEVFVAPDGDDSAGDGSAARPYATIFRARDEVRRRLAEGEADRGLRVTLRGGTYRIGKPFSLTPADSGLPEAPVVYRSAPGESVILSGGAVVTGFLPVADPEILRRLPPEARNHVYEADLLRAGIEPDSGSAAPGPGGRMDVFFDGVPMVPARWPDEGEWATVERWLGESEIPPRRHLGGTPTWRSGAFEVPAAARARPGRLEAWQREPFLKARGYWFWNWSQQPLEVQSVDPIEGIVQLLDPDRHSYGFRPGSRVYFYDALCELDAPGEWHVERESGRLFLYPPRGADPNSGSVTVSGLAGPLVAVTGASNLVFRGLVFAEGRAQGLVMADARNVQAVGCVFRSLGDRAVQIRGGFGNRVEGCDIRDVGGGGIHAFGGNVRTLEPGGHELVNNHIHRYAFSERVYRAAIQLGGVGLRAAHNLIHDAPHLAIGFSGNDHLIEFNEIHSVCLETDDAGAIYAGRHWAWRGHIIRHNFLHHVFSTGPGAGRAGVYLDDMFSSAEIFGNLFYRVTGAVIIGGGRDNRILNNLFVDSTAINLDGRALTWANYHADRWLEEMEDRGTIGGIAFDRPPYSERYPELAALREGTPKAPEGNVIARNISWGGRFARIRPEAEPYVTIRDNLVGVDPRFMDARNRDFRFRDDSPAAAIGFEPIPLERIGLIHDETRASWPVRHEVKAEGLGAFLASLADLAAGPPVYSVRRIEPGRVTPDGRIRAEEWGGEAEAMTIGFCVHGRPSAPAGHAWIRHDGDHLLVAVRVPLAPGHTVTGGSRWGEDDAVEIALANRAAGGDSAPTLVFRGYASGAFESSGEAGAPEAAVTAAGRGVVFACRVVDPSLWTAEWVIPFSSIGGIGPETPGGIRMAFNLTVRKARENLWQMWRPTRGPSWRVQEAGWIEIEW